MPGELCTGKRRQIGLSSILMRLSEAFKTSLQERDSLFCKNRLSTQIKRPILEDLRNSRHSKTSLSKQVSCNKIILKELLSSQPNLKKQQPSSKTFKKMRVHQTDKTRQLSTSLIFFFTETLNLSLKNCKMLLIAKLRRHQKLMRLDSLWRFSTSIQTD